MILRASSGARGMSVRAGFTLVEVLLVLAIIAVVTAITVPSFVRSIRGNRLRTSARTVVKAGKYARSMAVMNQREMVVQFDITKGIVSVLSVRKANARRAAASADDPFADGTLNALREEAKPEPESTNEGATNAVALVGMPEIVRGLDAVQIEYVVLGAEETEVSEGQCQVVYMSNGMCDPYQVKLVDEQGGAMLVSVDALSSAETERK